MSKEMLSDKTTTLVPQQMFSTVNKFFLS